MASIKFYLFAKVGNEDVVNVVHTTRTNCHMIGTID